MVQRYAPLVFLHDNEDAFPMDPGTFLADSKLAWANYDCGDTRLVDEGSIDDGRLVNSGYTSQASYHCGSPPTRPHT